MRVRGHDDTGARSVVFGILLLLLIVLCAAPAGAHATLVSTSPAPGAVLDDAPEQVSITFDEPVDVDSARLLVIDESGSTVSGGPTVDGQQVTVDLRDGADGWYAASWQVVSADGHPLSGGWTYRVGDASEQIPQSLLSAADGPATEAPARWGWRIAPWASTLAVLVLLGTLYVMALSEPTDGQVRLAAGASVATVAASILAAGLNGPGTGLAWFDGPASDHYLARGALAGLAGALAWSLRRRPPLARLAPASVATMAVIVTTLSGHARVDGGITVAVVATHLVVAGCWLGALPALALASRDTVMQFSRSALWLLAGVLVLGSAAAWTLSGGPSEVASTWGTILVVKVALVLVAGVVGGWNRYRVIPRWESLSRRARQAPLAIESLLLAAVVTASMALLHNGPPQEADASGPIQMETTEDDVTVTLVLDPGVVGTNDWHLYVTDATGLPLEVEEATVELSSDELGLAPIPQELSDLGAGHFSGRTDDIGTPGIWDVRVVVRPTPFTQVVLEDTVDVE